MQILEGRINHILFFNEENGYTVAIFSLQSDSKIKQKIVSSITIVATFDRKPYDEEEYILKGDITYNKKYGEQFKVVSFERKKLETIAGLIQYLSSDSFVSIGPKTANKLVDALGLDCLKKIKEDKSCLKGIGLSKVQQDTIYNGVVTNQATEETLLFLLDNGLTSDMAHKVASEFKEETKELLTKNPYLIMDKIPRFGFKKNDAFALSMGIDELSPIRLKAFICYLITETLFQSGNSYIEKDKLYQQLNSSLQVDIKIDLFNSLLKELIEERKIFVSPDDYVFDYYSYNEETSLALRLATIMKQNDKNRLTYSLDEINRAYLEVVKDETFELNELQQKAVKLAFTKPMVIITGGPGTGKTTIVHTILKLYFMLNGNNSALKDRIALLAPTGRAAKRLSELTSISASTIHRFLGYNGVEFEFDEDNKKNTKLVIVDESSMMDTSLANHLVQALEDSTRLILVGDVNQLPSVGPGQVLKDLIDSKQIETIFLSTIHRQSHDSSIIRLAHSIEKGVLPDDILEKLPDRNFIPLENEMIPEAILKIIKIAMEKSINVNEEFQVLIPMYKGKCGINSMNQLLQKTINPNKEMWKTPFHEFKLDDKVIQLVNHAEKNIMNGDIGYITNFEYENNKIVGMNVRFDQANVLYGTEDLDDLSLAYAISIHKSQGSEFNHVIIPICSEYYIMLKKKLIYTGITRAKKSLMLLGNCNLLNQAISRTEYPRKTILKNIFIENLKSPNVLKNSTTTITDFLKSKETINETTINEIPSIEDNEELIEEDILGSDIASDLKQSDFDK